eukprot:gene10371-2900_t
MSKDHYLSNQFLSGNVTDSSLMEMMGEKDTTKRVGTTTTSSKSLGKCHSCKGDVLSQGIKVNGNIIHQKCFTCSNCNKRLEKEYHLSNNKFMCGFCIQTSNTSKAPKYCTTCSKTIEGGKGMLFQGGYYHKDCFKCNFCNKAFTDKKIALKDGKPICTKCNTPGLEKWKIRDEDELLNNEFGSTLEDLEGLALMKKHGLITEQEFNEKKKKILGL